MDSPFFKIIKVSKLKAIGDAEEKDDIGHSEIVNHFNPQWIKFHTFP